MASIKKIVNKDGSISQEVRIRIKGHPTVTKTFKRLTDAREWSNQTETDIKRGLYFKTIEAQKHTLSELLDRYINNELHQLKTESERNKRIFHLNWWKDKIGAYRLSDITPSLLSEYKSQLITEYSPKAQNDRTTRTKATANRYIASLSVVFSIAVCEWGWMEDNPMSKVSKYKEPKGRTRFLSKDETKILLEECKKASNPLLYIFVVTALSTGARWSEIANITWKNVDFNNRMFYLMDTKNSEHRGVGMSADIYNLLKAYKNSCKVNFKWVFPKEDGTQPIDLRWQWDKAVERANLEDFTFHDLRHTAASNLAMNGASLTEIGEILGHKSSEMTKRYSHLTKKHTSAILENMNKEQFKGIGIISG
jgi:integrase